MNKDEYETLSTISHSSDHATNLHSCSVIHNHEEITSDEVSTSLDVIIDKQIKTKRKKGSSWKSSITPMQAKKLQKTLLNKKRNQFVGKRINQSLTLLRMEIKKIEIL